MKKEPQALIEATAEAIKAHFIPKDPGASKFSFHFTIPPASNYKANYERDEQGGWKLVQVAEEAN